MPSKMMRNIAAMALLGGFAVALPAQAPPPPGITRAQLQRHDLSTPGREVIQVRVGFAPGASFPDHRHPGEEIIYVTEGTFEYRVAGGPPVTVAAGGVLFIPAGAVHSARNTGSTEAAEIATYIVEKGRPLLEIIP